MTLFKKDVIKHSAAIQISNKVSLLQRRAWNVLLANAFDDMGKVDRYKVSIHDLATILNFDSNNIQYLKDILYNLVDTTVEWNILGKDRKEEWGVFSLLAEANIINGYCHYGYAPILREQLHNPSMYARISLSLQNQFKSKYALGLFELFLDYFQVKKGYGETPWIPLKEFRDLVGLEDDEYKEFKTLNHHVIKQPIKEINAISDLYIDLKDGILSQKERRRVVALKFIIRKNKDNIIDIETLETEQESQQRYLPFPEFEIDNQELFKILTTEFSIPSNLAMQILKTKDEYRINETLNKIRKQVELSENILSASDLAAKAFFPQERKKLQSSPIDEIEKRLREIPYHAFKKVRTQHADEVLLNALKELDFEIERRKKTGEKIKNLGGWFRSRLPAPGEPYLFSDGYKTHLQEEAATKRRQKERGQEEQQKTEFLKRQEAQHQELNKKIEAKAEELKANPREWAGLEKEALAKAETRLTPPDQTQELNELAKQHLKKLKPAELKKLEKEVTKLTLAALKGLNIDEKHPAFQNAMNNQKVEMVKTKYAEELSQSLHETPAYLAYQEKLTQQAEREIRTLVQNKLFA